MTCYRRDQGYVTLSDTYVPCYNPTSSTVSCCEKGDICGGFGFCYSSSRSSSVSSGYYLGGCTDPDFRDEPCNNHCTISYHDVVYDNDEDLWHCCAQEMSNGDSKLDCDDPDPTGFGAPGMLDVFVDLQTATAWPTPSTSTSSFFIQSTSTSSPATSTPASNTSRLAVSSSSVGFGSGSTTFTPQDAGPSIGRSSKDSTTTYVAAIVPTVLVLAAVVAAFFFWRKRRHAKRKARLEDPYGPQTNNIAVAKPPSEESDGDTRPADAELDSRSAMPEMGTVRERGELDSRSMIPELDPDRQKA